MADKSIALVKRLIATLVMMQCSLVASADLKSEAVEKTILAALPATKIIGIQESVISGLYEVMTPDNIFYVESQGRYLVIGRIVDLYTGTDLSAEALTKSRNQKRIDVSVPESHSVKFGREKPSVTVLFDPLCGYCIKLYRELLKVPNFSFALAVYPGDFDQGRVAPIAQVHCSPDPIQALDALIRSPQFPDRRGMRKGSLACIERASENVNQLMQWVKREKLHGTPILLSSDGRVSAGYKPAQEIMQWLNEGVEQ